MLSTQQVRSRIHPPFHRFVDYITQLANILAYTPQVEQVLLQQALTEASTKALQRGTARAFRLELVRATKRLVWNLPEDIARKAQAFLTPAEQASSRLSEIRAGSRENGERLAAAAERMAGWFNWVQSGPTEPKFRNEGQWGELYMPRETWDVSWVEAAGHTGYQRHETRRDDFAVWLNSAGPDLGADAHMNCWEAVFYCGFCAGLADKGAIMACHRRAAEQYRLADPAGVSPDHIGYMRYCDSLCNSLGLADGVIYSPNEGMVPERGEVLFWKDSGHVAISLGQRAEGNRQIDMCISLFTHGGGTFSILPVDEIRRNVVIKFAPCPFPLR